MKPVKFKESNTTFGEGQAEYQPLPAYYERTTGEVVTCWRLSFFERLRVLFTGRLWYSVSTFNRGLAPVFLTTSKKDILKAEKVD